MRQLYKSFLLVSCLCLLTCFTACDDEDIPDNFYSSTKVTAAGFIEQNDARFSGFRAILERSNYFTLLSTYGKFTLFAPTNDAVNRYLGEHGYRSVDDIPFELCDTLARTHIVNKGAYFTTDVVDDALPEMNMNDRYIVISCDSDIYNNNATIYYVNKRARIIERDDSVTNGVVHVIDNVLTASNRFLPDLIDEDEQLTIFSQALQLTGMADSLSKYVDLNYSCSNDSVTDGVRVYYGGYWQYAHFPEKRYYKYTAFCETDEVYRKAGINNLDDLVAYAKQTYDQVYPQDAGLYDEDFKNRKNPLNRFISYHLINRMGNYGDWVSSGEIKNQCCVIDIYDPEDFYETMAQGTIMRFCSPAHGLFINRKGLARNASVQGVKVLSPSESGMTDQSALNGVYHYIDGVLAYSKEVRDVVLNCRIRVDGTTMSPDFMNAGARGHFGEDYLTGFKNDFITDWKLSDETFIGVHSNELHWHSYEGNAVCITGIYDVSMKLPPVPSGTYEIRMGYTVGVERGVVQVYLSNEPCGIPIDLREYGPATNIGWVADTENEEDNTANDKAMRNRGYMKAMDSYRSAGGNVFRDNTENLRRILTTQYLDESQTYWLRFRQVLKDPECYLSFDYIELCPKSIYGSPEGEDRH
ncbi:MAG: fasciclin domain-containing protein [Prevotella sp.]